MSSLPAGGWIIRLNRVDLITLSSVPLTLLALFFTLRQELLTALALLFLAMTADALDGLLARRWGLTREFGRYLDGFMDVLIYLVSPALILLQWGFDGVYAVALVTMIAAGCIRLSVFNQTGNIEDASKGSARPAYLGMPVFWSLLIIAPLVLLEHWLGATAFIKALLALVLLWFRCRCCAPGRSLNSPHWRRCCGLPSAVSRCCASLRWQLRAHRLPCIRC
ncbi:MAG: CDP-alcohol phosphatidyltransferase family protein [Saccharospirillaceae bacterium]|nr:CDP-alcohol phosphatidyltransferase family protein [Saccharospirillaceae bacterium]